MIVRINYAFSLKAMLPTIREAHVESFPTFREAHVESYNVAHGMKYAPAVVNLDKACM
jgi:hypothetical protein